MSICKRKENCYFLDTFNSNINNYNHSFTLFDFVCLISTNQMSEFVHDVCDSNIIVEGRPILAIVVYGVLQMMFNELIKL